MTTNQIVELQLTEAESNKVHLALIEWGSNDDREPTVLLATSRYVVAMRAAEVVASQWCWCCVDDPGFLTQKPILADWGEEQVLAWLLELREATTVPWVTLSVEPIRGLQR